MQWRAPMLMSRAAFQGRHRLSGKLGGSTRCNAKIGRFQMEHFAFFHEPKLSAYISSRRSDAGIRMATACYVYTLLIMLDNLRYQSFETAPFIPRSDAGSRSAKTNCVRVVSASSAEVSPAIATASREKSRSRNLQFQVLTGWSRGRSWNQRAGVHTFWARYCRFACQ